MVEEKVTFLDDPLEHLAPLISLTLHKPSGQRPVIIND